MNIKTPCKDSLPRPHKYEAGMAKHTAVTHTDHSVRCIALVSFSY
jgi:hypothetical protein